MCGIVGYIGQKNARTILLESLEKLEYRGYDSAGIAVIEERKINIKKDKGRVKKLFESSEINGNIGIGHTRWATHGEPSKENSHPHLDNSKSFAVVHNGIIENYIELRNFLESKKYKFYSTTDTEVIPNLIHYFYNLDVKDDELKLLRAVNSTCNKLIGSFAIEVISVNHSNNIIVVRKDSPLVIGKGENENYISSDIPAILEHTKEFYFLNNLEFAVIGNDKIKFFNNNLDEIKKDTEVITWDAMSADKSGFDDYMLKEIFEQPIAIRETIKCRIKGNLCQFDELRFSKEYLSDLNQIYIVACGTAMHAGLSVKNTIEKLCKIRTEVDIASEFRYREPLIDDKTLCIYISQSGETADTIAALKLSKEKGAKTIAITNVKGSSITREADYTIYTKAGPEIAVASTKAYTSQITLLTLFTIYLAQILKRTEQAVLEDLINQILELPTKIEKILENTSKIEDIANQIVEEKHLFYLGRGIDYYTAQEASLKIKEISYIHSQSYAAGELKHGTIALIEEGINVIGIITDKKLLKKTISNIEEVITRGAIITIIINEKLLKDTNRELFKNIITVPDISIYLCSITSIIPLQLLAYYVSKKKDIDVDKPRNLAKSVTVE